MNLPPRLSRAASCQLAHDANCWLVHLPTLAGPSWVEVHKHIHTHFNHRQFPCGAVRSQSCGGLGWRCVCVASPTPNLEVACQRRHGGCCGASLGWDFEAPQDAQDACDGLLGSVFWGMGASGFGETVVQACPRAFHASAPHTLRPQLMFLCGAGSGMVCLSGAACLSDAVFATHVQNRSVNHLGKRPVLVRHLHMSAWLEGISNSD